jgi:acid phosphatase class B
VAKIKSVATKEDEMKFFIAEQNIGDDATKEQAEKLIELLKKRGWDVEYGIGRNVATDVSEFGQEEKIQESFADDFMLCISELTK